tara:strand:- start:283 stop:714 length:432 start_codon:yes stop_codon:yes gene_type:complete
VSKLRSFFDITSFGIYKHWNEKEKALPKIKTFTTDIPAELDIEFGFIVNCKKAKRKKLTYYIYHPDIPDASGQILPPFTGEVYVANNDWDFYLGDTIWLPLNNKVGDWRMVIKHDDQVLAEKTFSVLMEHGDGEIQFWKHRGY